MNLFAIDYLFTWAHIQLSFQLRAFRPLPPPHLFLEEITLTSIEPQETPHILPLFSRLGEFHCTHHTQLHLLDPLDPLSHWLESPLLCLYFLLAKQNSFLGQLHLLLEAYLLLLNEQLFLDDWYNLLGLIHQLNYDRGVLKSNILYIISQVSPSWTSSKSTTNPEDQQSHPEVDRDEIREEQKLSKYQVDS